MKILIAQKEPVASTAICRLLSQHHYMTDAVYSGDDALAHALGHRYDGIILDMALPEMDGLIVLERLRDAGNHTPVMFVTEMGEVESRIRGLDAGADDYLCKPFSPGELLARVRAMLRRSDAYVPEEVVVGNVTLKHGSRVLFCEGNSMPLSGLEYKLIELFMRNPGIVFSGDVLLEYIWGFDAQVQINTVWAYISYLRKKLKALHADVTIRAKRGVGYYLEITNE